MATYGKKEKVCATCAYWKGKRWVETLYIETREDLGDCSCDDIKTIYTCCCRDWKEV